MSREPRPVCVHCSTRSQCADATTSWHAYWAMPPRINLLSNQPCSPHTLLGRHNISLPVTHRAVHKEIGLWFYFAHGCSDIFWRMGRTLLARNKQDLFLKLAGGERDPKRAAALVQKLAPAYATEALNRSRHSRHWYVREYFSKAASNLMMRREELPLAWLLNDMARGLTSEEQCDVYASDPSRRCDGACATRARALAYVHHSDGLLDIVNERLLKKRVGTAEEIDTVQLYQQPQGLYSQRTAVELWDVRHLHSRFVPHALLFAKRRRGTRGLTGLSHLVPFHGGANGAACKLSQDWHSCLACENSSLERACKPWGATV